MIDSRVPRRRPARAAVVIGVAAALLLPLLSACAAAPAPRASTNDLIRTSSNGTISQAVVGAMSTVKPPAPGKLPTSVGQSSDFYGQPYPVMADIFGTSATATPSPKPTTLTCPTGTLDGKIQQMGRNSIASSSPTFLITGSGYVTNNTTATVMLSSGSSPLIQAWGGTGNLVQSFPTTWAFTGGSYGLPAGQQMKWTMAPTTVSNAVWWQMLSATGSPTAPMSATWLASQMPSGCAVTSPLLATNDAYMYELHTGYTGR